MSNSLQPHGLYAVHGIFQARILEWVAFPFSREIFPTQGLNPGLPHCRQILYQLSHKGSPRILEWVAYPFFSRSSWPRNQTGVSCIAGRFFTNSAIRELEKAEIKLPTFIESWKKQENSRKNIYFCFLDYAKAFDCVGHKKLENS